MKNFGYNDLFTGQPVITESGPTKSKTPNYRPALDTLKACLWCSNRKFHNKCKQVGVTKSGASNIKLDHTCDSWKERGDQRTIGRGK